jgi:predicted amidohydrolase YtcJ
MRILTAAAFGSDRFVAPPTPLEGIPAAVTRRTQAARVLMTLVDGRR